MAKGYVFYFIVYIVICVVFRVIGIPDATSAFLAFIITIIIGVNRHKNPKSLKNTVESEADVTKQNCMESENENMQDVAGNNDTHEWKQRRERLVEENRLRAKQLRLKYADLSKIVLKDENETSSKQEDEETEIVRTTNDDDKIVPLDIYRTTYEQTSFATINLLDTNKEGSYSTEKIAVQQPRQNHREPYATFAKMRKVGKTSLRNYGYYGDDAIIFYKQAEFMKDFVDDYDKTVPLDTYRTTYEQMSNEQLRTYFTWRTKVRSGNIEEISISYYAFCYIYELINGIGVLGGKDGIEKLISFWDGYRVHDSKIDSYVKWWIKDYYIAHSGEMSECFDSIAKRCPVSYEDYSHYIERIKQGEWDINFLEMRSAYKISKKAFYVKGNTKVIEDCLSAVLQAINNLFAKHNLDFIDLFWSKYQYDYWSPFRSAVYMPRKYSDKVVKLSEWEIYTCKKGKWSGQTYNFYNFPITKGYILKKIEIQMRVVFGGSKNLKAPSVSEIKQEFTGYNRSLNGTDEWEKQAYALIKSTDFEQTIINAIQEYCKFANIIVKDGKVTEIKPIEIDMSKLDKIKEEHEATAKKLIVEELPVEEIEPMHAEIDECSFTIGGNDELIASLTKDELDLLISLMKTGQASSNCEILIESINEKALSAIEDNVIDYADGMPYIYDEYLDDLKISVGGRNQ